MKGDEVRLRWLELFFALDMTAAEAEELRVAVDTAWYRIPDAEFDVVVETGLRVWHRTYGPIAFDRLKLFVLAFCPDPDAGFMPSAEPESRSVMRLRRSLDRLLADHRIERVLGEVYKPMNLLDTLARA